MKASGSKLTRRRFLGQASCAAVSATSLFSTLLNLRMANTMAAAPLTNIPGPNDYRALVCVFLHGGNDSFNMLVPYGTDEYAEYAAVRSNLALPRESLLPIQTKTDHGKQFGLHGSLPELQSLFENGKAAFMANVGTLVEPTTKTAIESGTAHLPLGLFSHSDQIRQWQTSIPDESIAVGWGGRLADILHSLNDSDKISMNISLDGLNVWQTGQQVFSYALSPDGVVERDLYEGEWNVSRTMGASIDSQLALEYQNLFERTFASVSRNAIDAQIQLSDALEAAPAINTIFPETELGAQLEMVARMISIRESLNMRRQTFFVAWGGWDHHDEVINTQQAMLAEVSAALGAFQAAMDELATDQMVTLFTSSDFGRTLTSNGQGSDHAWGGHQIVMGGAVKGQDIYGSYPDLYLEGPHDVGRGRIIPTTSVDSYFAELACWLGVSPGELPSVLPNINRFYDPQGGQAPLGFLL